MKKDGRLQFAVWYRVAALALGAVVAVFPASQEAYSATLGTKLVVNVRLERMVTAKIMGFGVQVDPYAYPPSKHNWNTIIKRVDYMQPAFLRVMVASDIPNTADQRILAWAQRHHSQVILGTWRPTPAASDMPAGLVRSWARHVALEVRFLRQRRGFSCIRLYNFVNEPERVPISRWADLANNLHAAFERAGLAGKVGIIGPDTYGDPRANYPRSITFKWNISAAARAGYNWPLLAQVAHEASRDVGMFDIHWYARNNEILNNIVERTLVREKQMVESLAPGAGHKPFVISESGLIQGRRNGDQQPRVKTFTYGVMMADYAAQVFRAGWDGISAWDLDDAMHVVNGKPITHPPGKLTLKIWGFWNSQGAAMGDPADFNIRPWFYTWSLMSRMFPAGTRIVNSTEPAHSRRFRTLAGTHLVSGKPVLSVVLVNDDKVGRNVVVRIAADTNNTTFTEYRYFRADRPVNAEGFPVPAKVLHDVIPAHGITITMPGQGVVFLTNQGHF